MKDIIQNEKCCYNGIIFSRNIVSLNDGNRNLDREIGFQTNEEWKSDF